jgi:DNA invertase Pin-like site-specific DNA recombinase
MAKKPDPEKIKKIKRVLRESPQGLWIREIARRAGMSKSTVSKYINEYMKDDIEDVWKKEFIRIVRLKK